MSDDPVADSVSNQPDSTQIVASKAGDAADGSEETVLGVPRQRPSSEPRGANDQSAEIASLEPVVTTDTRLEPDEAFGIPRRPPRIEAERVSAEDSLFRDASVSDQDSDSSELEVDSHRPRFGAFLVALVVGVMGVLALFFVGELSHLISTLELLAGPLRWTGYLALVLIGLAIAMASGRLIWTFVRLSASRAPLEELAHRTKSRQEAAQSTKLARDWIRRFLATYPLEDAKKVYLKRLGFSESTLEELKRQRDQLLKEEWGSVRQWLRDVDGRFLQSLDKVASARIKRYAVSVGVKTAVTPVAFVDSAVVLINVLEMVTDLCSIYNLRTSGWSTVRVVGHLFLNMAIAGHLEQITEEIGTQLASSIQELAGQAIAKVAGKFVAHGAEGLGNALLMYRLGRMTVRLLRPIQPAIAEG